MHTTHAIPPNQQNARKRAPKTDPLRRPTSLEVVERRDLTLAGPQRVVQGYDGLFLRVPIFIDNVTDANETWG